MPSVFYYWEYSTWKEVQTAMKASRLISKLQANEFDDLFTKIYVDSNQIEVQKKRYTRAIQEFLHIFGDQDVEIYSAPGRSEIGGNHTDHQYGKVIAASVNIDTIAIVSKTDDLHIHIKSEGYKRIDLDLSDLASQPAEKGTTAALIRGVAAGMKSRGYAYGGFNAYVTSQVLTGSGLSSSAAYEVLIGTILSGLYNDSAVDAITIAQIGQEAENIYFGKPSGLMDQMACSVGGLIYIDFEDPEEPIVEKIDTDFSAFGHSLCIVDTKGSHADLTDDYADIPADMRKVASYFGVDVLRQIDQEVFYKELSLIRKYAGDRAVLRTIHFFDENRRVEREKKALEERDFDRFKELIWDSGQSSYKYLQNVYSTKKPEDQSLAVALLMTRKILKNRGVWRVHGGGFAGTIQAFVPDDFVAEYKTRIEELFGKGSCYVLKVRPVGGIKII